MTQAFNLSQFANTLDVNGKTDLGTGVRNTLPVANGGTGITAPGTSGNVLTSNGTAWVSLAATSGFSGGTVNAASGTALTLTSSSTQVQVVQFTSVVNSIVTLPSATTLTAKGAPIFRIINNSQCNAPITIKNAAGTVLASVSVTKGVDITLADNSTSAGVWYCDDVAILPTPSTIDPNSLTQASITYGAFSVVSSYVMALTDSTYVLCMVGIKDPGTTWTANFGAIAITVSGSSFTVGSLATVLLHNADYRDYTNTLNGRVEAFRMTSTTGVIHGGLSCVDAIYSSPTSCCGGGYTYYSRASQGSVVFTVSGTTCTLGAVNANNLPTSFAATNNLVNSTELSAYIYNPTRFAVSGSIFATVGNTSWTTNGTMADWRYGLSGNLQVTLTSISGTTQTNGTAVSLGANIGAVMAATSHTANAFVMSYYTCSALGSSNGIRKTVTCANSGTTPTWGTASNLDASVVQINTSTMRCTNSVVLSTTKVVLPYFLADQYQFRVVNISGTTPTATTNIMTLTTSTPMFIFRSSTEFLALNEQSTQMSSSNNPLPTTPTNTNRTFSKYAVSAADVIYKKTDYTFVADSQSTTVLFVAGIPLPTSGSTTCIAGTLLSPSGQIYLVKGTLPA